MSDVALVATADEIATLPPADRRGGQAPEGAWRIPRAAPARRDHSPGCGWSEGSRREGHVLVEGTQDDIERVAATVSAKYRAERKARNKAAEKSRRANR